MYDEGRGEKGQHLEPDSANWFELTMKHLYSEKSKCHLYYDPYLMSAQLNP